MHACSHRLCPPFTATREPDQASGDGAGGDQPPGRQEGGGGGAGRKRGHEEDDASSGGKKHKKKYSSGTLYRVQWLYVVCCMFFSHTVAITMTCL